jgi:phage-related protein
LPDNPVKRLFDPEAAVDVVISVDLAFDPHQHRAALLRQLDRLNDLSDRVPHLPFPHSSQVDGELRELRCHMGSEHYRVLYRRSERLIVLLHAFRKTTGKLPAAEIKIAQKHWEDFKARMPDERLHLAESGRAFCHPV